MVTLVNVENKAPQDLRALKDMRVPQEALGKEVIQVKLVRQDNLVLLEVEE